MYVFTHTVTEIWCITTRRMCDLCQKESIFTSLVLYVHTVSYCTRGPWRHRCRQVEILLNYAALCWIYCIHISPFYTTDANCIHVFVAVKSNSEGRQSANPPLPPPDIIAQMSCRAVIAKNSQMKGQGCSWRTCRGRDGPRCMKATDLIKLTPSHLFSCL